MLPGQGALVQDDEERVRLRVRGPDSLGDALAIGLLSIAGGVVLALDARWAAVRWLAPLVAAFFAYRALARWSGATQVDLEGDELRITRLGAPWPGSNARIPASEIVQLGVVELVEFRSRNLRLRRYALVARLRDGSKRVLVTGCHAREPLEEAERAFERRLGIVDVPLHELPALPLRVESGDELALPGVDVHAIEPGLVVAIGLPARHGGYREAAVEQSPWLRVHQTRASALRDLWLLLIAPLFALPVALLVYNAPKLSTGMWVVSILFLTVIGLTGYAVTKGVILGILRLLRLEIRDGVVRTVHLERDATLVESVELSGEPGTYSIDAYTDGLAWQLLGSLPSEAEARWLAARIREVLRLPPVETEAGARPAPSRSSEATLPAQPPLR